MRSSELVTSLPMVSVSPLSRSTGVNLLNALVRGKRLRVASVAKEVGQAVDAALRKTRADPRSMVVRVPSGVRAGNGLVAGFNECYFAMARLPPLMQAASIGGCCPMMHAT